MHRWYPFKNTSFYRYSFFLLLILVLSTSTSFNAQAVDTAPSLAALPNLPLTGSLFGKSASINHLPPPWTDSWNSRDHLPSLNHFTTWIENGQAGTVRGVYVPGFLALPVLQQPSGNLGFVSQKPGTVTQFQLAARYDVIGLLAHNFLSGKEFYRLFEGLRVMIIGGDRSVKQYRITEVRKFQKLSPGSNWSHYISLDSGERLTTYQVFNQFYQGDHHLTFQTCLEKDGLETWGLLFIVAEPIY
jgi:hypothetical protein